MTPRFRATLAAVLLAAVATLPAAAQVGGAGTGGASRLLQQRRLEGNWRRVLMIGAHPDDEDTELLAILARGQGIETGYLSLTRGDGGQNLIGPELGEALGVLRSEELAAARRIDGGRQFFTRAYDYGFSKTLEEALRFWPRDSVVKDMVRIIRRFRPQVIISVWTGTPSDGHGHHQAAGVLALDAFHAAGDPAKYPELQREEGLRPWQPAKFYRSSRFSSVPTTLTFDGGVIDPATGLSYHQIAVRSRSQHRSQNQGRLEELGPSQTRIGLVERVPTITGPDDSLFAGIPPEAPPASDPHRAEVRLIEGNVVVDATTDDDEVAPGQVLPVTLTVWNAGKEPVVVSALRVMDHAGYAIADTPCAQATVTLAAGSKLTCRQEVTVLPGARADSPYFLEQPRTAGMYVWSGDPSVWGEPFAAPLTAEFKVATGAGPAARVTREVQGRFLDPVQGELRRPVEIVPRVAVSLSPDRILWPRNTTRHPFIVSLEHLARDSATVQVSLQLPAGWQTGPGQSIRFTREGERAQVRFDVVAPAGVANGEYAVTAIVIAGKDSLTTGLTRIRYPDLTPRNIATHAVTKVTVADVVFPKLATIGYVRGGGDLVPEALTNAGLAVELLTGEALERGPLDRFRVIVIGPRAYEADESLVRAHPRLMRWLEAGGTLIIQYQQIPYVRGGFPPRPLTLVPAAQSRVTDETADVTILAKTHQAVQWPNVIGAADFDGWVQERGLDYAPTYDPAWTPILSMHDPGEKPLDGGLLVAKVGKGTAVYTGLALHRQLPATVPGAWRLFANLLGLGQTPVVKR
jgi:LmbE family N-acetylglucosaminyl deacetylase